MERLDYVFNTKPLLIFFHFWLFFGVPSPKLQKLMTL